MEEKRCVPWSVLKHIVPFSRQHRSRLEEPEKYGLWNLDDPFPRRVQVGQCRVCWWLHEVYAWLERRQRAR